MCEHPPPLFSAGFSPAPIYWLLFGGLTLLFLLWFTPTYRHTVEHFPLTSKPPLALALLIASHACLLIGAFLLLIVAFPWLEGFYALCGTVGYYHHPFLVGTVNWVGLIAFACIYSSPLASAVRSRVLQRRFYSGAGTVKDDGQQKAGDTIRRPLMRGVLVSLALSAIAGVILAYALSLNGAGCDEGCGYIVGFISLLGYLIACLAFFIASILCLVVLAKTAMDRQWSWLVGMLLFIVVDLLLIGALGQLQWYWWNPPNTFLIFTPLALTPVAPLLYVLDGLEQRHA